MGRLNIQDLEAPQPVMAGWPVALTRFWSMLCACIAPIMPMLYFTHLFCNLFFSLVFQISAMVVDDCILCARQGLCKWFK